jgi:hypothetical protein
MEAARTSETLINFYQTTQRYNPEDHINIFTAVRTSNLSLFQIYSTTTGILSSERQQPNERIVKM